MRLAKKVFLRFEYHLIKLKALDYRAFLASGNPLAYALMAKMNYNRRDRVKLKAEFLRLILSDPIDSARQSMLAQFVDVYIPLDDFEQKEFKTMISKDRELVKVEGYIFSWQRDALKQGILTGERAGLRRMLEFKFGPLGEDTIVKLEAADHELLSRWYEQVLPAATIEDVFASTDDDQ